jgi:hypothetical protein
VNIRPAFAEDRFLPGQRRCGGSVPRAGIRKARIGLGQGTRVRRGLQQCGYPLGLVGQDPRGPGLEDQIVLVGAGQEIGVGRVPPLRMARVRHVGQDDLLLFAYAVLGKQVSQLIAPYSALPGLDPADLR